MHTDNKPVRHGSPGKVAASDAPEVGQYHSNGRGYVVRHLHMETNKYIHINICMLIQGFR